MSAQRYDVAPLDAMDHCHGLLDEAKVPREIPAGRSAGLIERVAWLVSDAKRLRTQRFLTRWTAEAMKHGHFATYYNDSECRGCAALRGSDPELANAAHEYANLTPARVAPHSKVTP